MRVRDGLVLVTDKAKYFGGLDLALRYNPLARGPVGQAIASCRVPNPSQRRATVNRLTDAIIARARKTHYGRRFDQELSHWPILSKEQVRDRPRDFVVPGLLQVPAATGGTTGIPLRLTRSLRCVAAEQLFLDSLLAPYDLNWSRARIAVLRTDRVKDLDDHRPPFGKETHWGRRLVLSSPHLSAETLDWFLERLAAFRPDILYSVPNYLANLVMLLAQSGRRLQVPLVVSSSSRLDSGLYETIKRELSTTVIDYYGLAERSAFAIRTGPEEWFFEPAYGKVELVASPTDEIVGAQRQVQIVATGFWNEAQPLIRYDTGDRALVPAESGEAELEAIALGERPFFGIAGRDNEFILAPDGRRITGLNVISYEVRNILQLQLVQDAPDHLLIRVLALPGFGPPDRARLIANARTKVPTAIAIDIAVVDWLETTARGKVPYTIRRIEGMN
jgi:phenylacetate-CoA ligase